MSFAGHIFDMIARINSDLLKKRSYFKTVRPYLKELNKKIASKSITKEEREEIIKIKKDRIKENKKRF